MKNSKEIANSIIKLLVFFLLLSSNACGNENEFPSFLDDKNLRLKSISSYRIENPNQIFTIFFNYDGKGRLISTESNSLGSTIEFKYDDQERLIKVGDYEYYYDDNNRVEIIKNKNLTTSAGQYDSTYVSYNQEKIASITERFSDNSIYIINTLNISYNNKNQINKSSRTVRYKNLELGQDFIQQLDREEYTYSSSGLITKIRTEEDYESGNTPVAEIEYVFDSYKNPIQLILKTLNIENFDSMIGLSSISERSHFSVGSLFNYFNHNVLLYSQIPQTENDDYVQYQYEINYKYNEFGYPTSAIETQTLLNRNIEYSDNITWEYEEY